MPTAGVSGVSVAVMAAGGILAWSGIYNQTVPTVLRSIISGQAPAAGPAASYVSTAATTSGGTSGGSAAAGDTGAGTQTAAHNQAIAKLLAAPYGWSTGQNWTDLVSLWNKESGWNNTADNPSSGAYGIAQALPPTKYPAAGQASGGSSPNAQIAWGLSYIQSTYGSPTAAWAHETADNWY